MRRLLPTAATALTLPALAAAQSDGTGIFTGGVRPVNPETTSDAPVGEMTVTTEGDEIAVFIEGGGFAPGRHMVHIHGFAESDPAEAACPPPGADANDDAIVDLVESRKAAGETLVPLNGAPAKLDIGGGGYPRADETGELDYIATISDAALTEALREAKGTPPAIARRVVMVHGVMENAGLPESVRSLEGVPARVTLPVACAELTAEE